MARDVRLSSPLFGNKERTRLTPANYAEPSYTFFDESARPECASIRLLLEGWFARYPDERKDELRTLIQSTNKSDFSGAFFELYCYTLLSRQGFTLEVHPILPNGKKTHPDFRLRVGEKPVCYFESTVARSRDAETEWHLACLYDHLNRIRLANFMFDVVVYGIVPKTTPPIKAIRRLLRDWLDAKDPDAAIAAIKLYGNSAKERRTFRSDGWHLEFTEVPLRKELRGGGGVDQRPLGGTMHVGRTSFVDVQQPLLNALHDKGAGHYGEMDLPYIVAVNVRSEPTDDSDICAALFGHEAVSRTPETGKWTLLRMRDGFWMQPRKPRNTRVSAVLVTSLLEPFRVAMAQPVLWHNPWAEKPLDPDLWQGPHRILHVDEDLSRGELEARGGTPAYELLGLDPDWPHIQGIGQQWRR